MEANMRDHGIETPEMSKIGVRALAPIWNDVANENDVVMRCAQAFATAFDRNPAEPRLRDIAREAGCSRNAVRDHLAEAKRRGMLSLSLRLPKKKRLSDELAEEYGLAEAVVTLIPTKWNDQDSIRSALATEVMRYFERFCIRLIETNENRKLLSVGIDGGRTLDEAVREALLSRLPKIKYELVPLVFGPLAGSQFTASVVANVLASKLDALGANAVVQDGFEVRPEWTNGNGNRKEPRFAVEITSKSTLSPLDLLFVGIGSPKAGLLQRELLLLPRSQRTAMTFYGDILNLAFDQKGQELKFINRSRAALLTLKDLQRLSSSPSTLVVGVAGGKEKVNAIRTVLRCRYVSVLITDPATAGALLEE
jgi:DNA-binding transcriptional regulator LsrR (DeoR family)